MESLVIAKSKIDRLSDDPVVRSSQIAAVYSDIDDSMAEIVDIRYWLSHARRTIRTIYTESIEVAEFDFCGLSKQLEDLYRRLFTICERVDELLKESDHESYCLDHVENFRKVHEELRQEVNSFDVGEILDDSDIFDEDFLTSVGNESTD